MKILGVIVVMLIFLPQQTQTIERDPASNKSGIESVLQLERTLNRVPNPKAPLTKSQANNAADANARLAISVWNDLNAMCRGGSGDRPETEYACCLRSKVDSLLNNLGYCYHMGDAWRKCQPRDKRSARAGSTACVK